MQLNLQQFLSVSCFFSSNCRFFWCGLDPLFSGFLKPLSLKLGGQVVETQRNTHNIVSKLYITNCCYCLNSFSNEKLLKRAVFRSKICPGDRTYGNLPKFCSLDFIMSRKLRWKLHNNPKRWLKCKIPSRKIYGKFVSKNSIKWSFSVDLRDPAVKNTILRQFWAILPRFSRLFCPKMPKKGKTKTGFWFSGVGFSIQAVQFKKKALKTSVFKVKNRLKMGGTSKFHPKNRVNSGRTWQIPRSTGRTTTYLPTMWQAFYKQRKFVLDTYLSPMWQELWGQYQLAGGRVSKGQLYPRNWDFIRKIFAKIFAEIFENFFDENFPLNY